jgi:hypothetical protein
VAAEAWINSRRFECCGKVIPFRLTLLAIAPTGFSQYQNYAGPEGHEL